MVTDNSSKVLTVSYGTFSCTLEGFENSFDMMKTVAEYFRDLAAEDRFFGAEPPKLDAEILGILEQRGKQLGINTRQSGDTSIVLTPSQSYEEDLGQASAEPITEPSAPVSAPALSIDERLDRIKAATTADTLPAVYSEDEHADDTSTEHGVTHSEISAPLDTADTLDNKEETGTELPNIVDHIEFDNTAKHTDAPAEANDDDKAQEAGSDPEIVDHSDTGLSGNTDQTVDATEAEIAEHPEAINDVQEHKVTTAETVIQETATDTFIDEGNAAATTDDIDQMEHDDLDAGTAAEYDEDDAASDTVETNDTPEMDEFEAALTQDLMDADDELDSALQQNTPVLDDPLAGDETAGFEDAEDEEALRAQERSPLRLE